MSKLQHALAFLWLPITIVAFFLMVTFQPFILLVISGFILSCLFGICGHGFVSEWVEDHKQRKARHEYEEKHGTPCGRQNI